MRTFSIQTLGCKVNHYETEQWATLLRARGLTQVDPADADLRVINSCSVTTEAASKSRQLARRATRLPVLGSCGHDDPNHAPTAPQREPGGTRARVIVTGCWATSDRSAAAALQGIDAVITHHDDVAAELTRLLSIWLAEGSAAVAPRPNTPTGDRANPGRLTKSDEVPPNQEQVLPTAAGTSTVASGRRPESLGNEEWMTTSGGLPELRRTPLNKSSAPHLVKEIPVTLPPVPPPLAASPGTDSRRKQTGTATLPLLHQRQPSHQRAHLKIQDGCDAHCTYCIIPSLRPALWTKPIREAVEEAKRLTDAGHVELVLTGIFLGAYGHPTALRRRQVDASPTTNLTALIDALCTAVPGLRRLRLSSLEPGDLTPDLIAALKSHPQVVPHFHLPLQSGSDRILHRMNRQYTRADFLHMADAVHAAFDRPALTTDVIAGFPGEADDDFARTVEVVERVGFIHVHAFPFSPRPGTAAARWKDQFVHGAVAAERIARLRALAARGSVRFRNQFLGRTVELLVERWDEKGGGGGAAAAPGDLRHGRSERYFDVFFDGPDCRPGDAVRVRIDRVTESRTFGTRVPAAAAAAAAAATAATRGDA